MTFFSLQGIFYSILDCQKKKKKHRKKKKSNYLQSVGTLISNLQK